jgi:hypothetical protein
MAVGARLLHKRRERLSLPRANNRWRRENGCVGVNPDNTVDLEHCYNAAYLGRTDSASAPSTRTRLRSGRDNDAHRY